MGSISQGHYDVAVVGLGALGSAAAYFAVKKGAKVIAFEQFELGHVKGASHDTSRIVRRSYEAPEYVALAKSTYHDWAQLEKDAKQKLLTITGGVVIMPKDTAVPTPDEWNNGAPTAAQWARTLDGHGIPYERLSHVEANKRWPAFDLKDDREVVYTPDTGIAHAYKSITAMQFLARVGGAEMMENTKVISVTPGVGDAGSVLIETSNGSFSASKVILAADAWVNELLHPLGLDVPMRITQEQVTYFKPEDPSAYQPDKFPVWIWADAQWYYGFPCYGEPAIKAGPDNSQQFTTPAERTFVPNAEKVKELSDFMQRLAPDSGRQELRTVTCQYAMTANRQFVISPVKGHEDIICTLGAGHAFKFAPAIGRVAAELAIDGKTTDDISKFKLETVAEKWSHKDARA
jgi:sarcosine oxidase